MRMIIGAFHRGCWRLPVDRPPLSLSVTNGPDASVRYPFGVQISVSWLAADVIQIAMLCVVIVRAMVLLAVGVSIQVPDRPALRAWPGWQ